MAVLRGVFRVYSWIFEAVLCAMAIGVAAVTVFSGNEQLKLGWLPWDSNHLPGWLFGIGLFGLLCVLVAVTGRFRILLFLFALAVFILLAKGFFYGLGYSFQNEAQAKSASILTAAAFVAWLGAWPRNGAGRRTQAALRRRQI